MLSASIKTTKGQRRFLPLVVLTIGLIASFASWRYALSSAEHDARTAFERSADDSAHRLRDSLTRYSDLVTGLQAFVDISADATRSEFKRYVAALAIAAEYPAVLALQFAPVPKQDDADDPVAVLSAASRIPNRFASDDDRLGADSGQVAAVLRVRDIVKRAMPPHFLEPGAIVLDDTGPWGADAPLRLFGDAASVAPGASERGYDLAVGGRFWRLRIYAPRSFGAHQAESFLVLLGGLALSVVGTLYARNALRQQAVTRERAQALADSLRERDLQYHTIVESVQEVVCCTDAAGRIELLNPAWADLTGFALEDSIGKPILDYFVPEDRDRIRAAAAEARHSIRGKIEWTARLRTAYGTERTVEARARFVRDASGAIKSATGTLVDVTRRVDSERAARHAALHDPLTGLGNRALLQERLTTALSQARLREERLGLLYLDLDNFKPINDRYGHVVGDHVLKIAAERLRHAVRTYDTVARVGGDEFVVVLPGIDRRDAESRFTRIIETVLAEPITLPEGTLAVGSSIGIALFPDDGADAASLIRHADAAMYRAKAARRALSAPATGQSKPYAPDDQ